MIKAGVLSEKLGLSINNKISLNLDTTFLNPQQETKFCAHEHCACGHISTLLTSKCVWMNPLNPVFNVSSIIRSTGNTKLSTFPQTLYSDVRSCVISIQPEISDEPLFLCSSVTALN